MTDSSRARAWGWVAHLRDGGTTPWGEYVGTEAGDGVDAVPQAASDRLPGVQQLELLRRINAATGGRTVASEVVLRASLAGRGQPELGLAGVDDLRPESDPSEVSDAELLRVAASAIADSLIVGGLPDPVEAPPQRRRSKPFQLVGNPWLAIPMREELARAGYPSGGPRSQTYVLGGNFEQMVIGAWSAACFDNGPAPWDTWLAKWVERDRPPARADLARIAARHGQRARSVQIVLDPLLLRGLLGVRRQIDVPGPLAVHALEVSRRVAVVLGGLVSSVERVTLLRGRLLPVLSEVPGPRLAFPKARADWAGSQAERMRATLTQAGYPVQGEWDDVISGAQPSTAKTAGIEAPLLDGPSDAGTLKVAIRLLGREAW